MVLNFNSRAALYVRRKFSLSRTPHPEIFRWKRGHVVCGSLTAKGRAVPLLVAESPRGSSLSLRPPLNEGNGVGRAGNLNFSCRVCNPATERVAPFRSLVSLAHDVCSYKENATENSTEG